MENIIYIKKQLQPMTFINLLKSAGVLLLTFLAPIKGLIIILSLLAILDSIYAIYAAHKRNENITWDKFKKIFLKIPFYISLLVIAFLIDVYIGGGTFWGISFLVSKAVTLLFSWKEVMSLDKTNVSLNGKSIYVSIKELFSFAKEVKNDMDDLIDSKKDENK